VIGIHNHGTISIGDSFSEGEPLTFTGIPNFAPELFRRAAEAAELDDPGEETHRVQTIHADRAPLCFDEMNSVVIFEYLSIRDKQQ